MFGVCSVVSKMDWWKREDWIIWRVLAFTAFLTCVSSMVFAFFLGFTWMYLVGMPSFVLFFVSNRLSVEGVGKPKEG